MRDATPSPEEAEHHHHRSPLLWLLLGMGLGCTLGKTFEFSGMAAFIGGVGFASLAFIFCRAGRFYFPLWALAYVSAAALSFASLWKFNAAPSPPEHFDFYRGKVIVQLERMFAPQAKGKLIQGFGLIKTAPPQLPWLAGHRIYFKAWNDNFEIVRGTEFAIEGKLSMLGASTDFENFLHQNGCEVQLKGRMDEVHRSSTRFLIWCSKAKLQLMELLAQGADTKQTQSLSQIATAMTLGNKSSLSRSQKKVFRLSGAMHLFAVSGLHVGLVALSLAWMLALLRIPKFPAALLGLGIVFLYVQIIDAPPSAMRAWLMAVFFWGAWVLRRRPSGVSALVASACVVLLLNPRELFSVGFQLSYTVVAGILLYGLPLGARLRASWKPFEWIPIPSLTWQQRLLKSCLSVLCMLFGIAFSASLFSAPLSIGYFGLFTPGGVIANMFLVQLAAVAVLAEMLAVAGGLLGLGFLTEFFNAAAWVFIIIMESLATWLHTLPFFYWKVGWREPSLGVLIAIAMVACVTLTRTTSLWRLLLPPAILAVALAAMGTRL